VIFKSKFNSFYMAIKLNIPVLDLMSEGYNSMEVDAEMLKETIGGKHHFVHRNLSGPENWAVSEYESGARTGWGWSIQSAITRAESNIRNVGTEKYDEMVKDAIATYGKGRINEDAPPNPSDKSWDEIEKELVALCPIEIEADDDDY
jgi:hypothetical protein